MRKKSSTCVFSCLFCSVLFFSFTLLTLHFDWFLSSLTTDLPEAITASILTLTRQLTLNRCFSRVEEIVAAQWWFSTFSAGTLISVAYKSLGKTNRRSSTSISSNTHCRIKGIMHNLASSTLMAAAMGGDSGSTMASMGGCKIMARPVENANAESPCRDLTLEEFTNSQKRITA